MLDCDYSLEKPSAMPVSIRYYARRRYITRAFVRQRCVVNIV